MHCSLNQYRLASLLNTQSLVKMLGHVDSALERYAGLPGSQGRSVNTVGLVTKALTSKHHLTLPRK